MTTWPLISPSGNLKPGLVLLRAVAAEGGLPEFVTAPTGAGTIPPLAPEPVAPIRVVLLDIPPGQGSSAASFHFAACPLGGRRFLDKCIRWHPG